MNTPTPLEIANALRSAAEFCRDPASPKCVGHFAQTKTGMYALPWEPDAASWCAIGYAESIVGCDLTERVGECGLSEIAHAFDAEDHESAAQRLDALAAEIESTVPTTTRAAVVYA